MKQRKPRGVFASQDGRELMEEAKATLGWTNEKIAEMAESNVRTVRSFLKGTQRIDCKSARNIVAMLNLDYRKVVPLSETINDFTSQTIEKLESEPDGDQAANLIQEIGASLTHYQESEGIELTAIKWLELSRNEIIEINDIESEILRLNSSEQPNELISPERVIQDLEVYIEIIQACLELGSLQLIDSAIEENLIPNTYNADIYVHFLRLIKDSEILNKAPLAVSKKVLIVINYLISVLPIKL